MKLIIEVEVSALSPAPHQGSKEDKFSATMRIDANDEFGRIRIRDCVEKSRRQHKVLMEIAEDIDKAISLSFLRHQGDRAASSAEN